MTSAAACATAADPGSATAAVAGGLIPASGWIVLALVVLQVAGKVLIVWLALRSTAPGDRAPIIHALAALLRQRGTARGDRAR